MNMTQIRLSEIILEDEIRRNSEYIMLGIEEWDKCGEGEFAEFIYGYAKRKWDEMARRN